MTKLRLSREMNKNEDILQNNGANIQINDLKAFFEAIDWNQLRFHYVIIKALSLVFTTYIIKFIILIKITKTSKLTKKLQKRSNYNLYLIIIYF